MLSFLERSKYLTINDEFFNKEKTYFEAGATNTDGKTWRQYFRKNNTKKR